MGLVDVVVLLVIGALVCVAVRSLLRKGSSCSSCPSSVTCQVRDEKSAVCPRAAEALAIAERDLAGDEDRR